MKTTNDFESHSLAGGNISRVVQALIVANKVDIALEVLITRITHALVDHLEQVEVLEVGVDKFWY